MTSREMVPATTEWVDAVGYSRAVRSGAHVYVAGTTALDGQGRTIAPGDGYSQTVAILKKIEAALQELDCPLGAVVRTRVFMTDIDQWKDVGRAHREFFGDILPASSMVEVNRLMRPDLVVEIEADALISEEARR